MLESRSCCKDHRRHGIFCIQRANNRQAGSELGSVAKKETQQEHVHEAIMN